MDLSALDTRIEVTAFDLEKAGFFFFFDALPSSSIVERIKPPADVQAAIDERMKPGMVFVTTDQPATPETRSGKDFTVMDSEGK